MSTTPIATASDTTAECPPRHNVWMAARRLIAFLIMLLVISSLAAALSPQPDRDETTSSDETTTTATATEAPDRDEVLREVVPAKPGKPVRIEAAVGDQLQLEVEATGPTTVEISSLGLTGFATPGAPARFDLLLRAEGTNQVTLGAATTVARIRVSEGG